MRSASKTSLLYIIKIANKITWRTRHSYGQLKRALEKETLITDTDKLTELPPVMLCQRKNFTMIFEDSENNKYNTVT